MRYIPIIQVGKPSVWLNFMTNIKTCMAFKLNCFVYPLRRCVAQLGRFLRNPTTITGTVGGKSLVGPSTREVSVTEPDATP